MLEIIQKAGCLDVAEIYVAAIDGDMRKLIEFVDAVDPRYPRREKWVINTSTQAGCPVGCAFCDAGYEFRGNLSAGQIFEQIEYIMRMHSSDGTWDSPKIKLHFARMGEPSLNPAVLAVLRELPERYPLMGIIPTIPTIAPREAGVWFDELVVLKDELYGGGRFQLQFSVNSTDEAVRDSLMPVPKWSLREIAAYGERWHRRGDRKLTLNFALARDVPCSATVIAEIFNPAIFLVKLTPVNPTYAAEANGLESILTPEKPDAARTLVDEILGDGFEVIVSIGDPEELALGSNCGQLVAEIHRDSV